MKRNKLKIISTFLVAILCAGLFVFMPTANAASTYDPSVHGNQKSARLKEWLDPFEVCLKDAEWDTDGGNPVGPALWANRLKPQGIREGDWWWSNMDLFAPSANPYVETTVSNNKQYSDGKISCGENDNALLSNVMSELSNINSSVTVDKKDIVCDYEDHTLDGALGTDGLPCNIVYENDYDYNKGYYFLDNIEDSQKTENVHGLIKDKLFGGSIPGGDLYNLSTLERYYIVHDAFTYACTASTTADERGGNLNNFRGNGHYIIKEYDSSSKKLIEVGYYGRKNPSPNSNIYYFRNNSATCQDMANFLRGEGETSIAGDAISALEDYIAYLDENGIDPSEEQDQNEDDDAATDNCQNSGGAGSLGWIVCPILGWMQEATNGLYTSIVEPSLQVRSSFFNTSDGSGQNTYKAWGVFRDIANVIFAILVLFVIFSQLTGVGIDNYGIKKILPKLIVAAVLINLSYLICVLCVDLSNIIGSGIKDFLDTLGNDINNASSIVVDSSVAIEKGSVDVSNVASFGILAVGVVSAAVGVYAVYSNPALLLTLFVSVLGVFISILFVFILLAGRQAAIILLTVVSPVAFILYMLPNTKKIFDKWLNLWKAMLLLYPICGLLIGGGNFASSLMLSISDGGIAIVFTAMIVGIIPIFFIPSLLRSAFAAMGNIGGAISGFSSRLRGGANRALTGNPLYKNLQARGQERQERLGNIRQERRKYRGAARRAGVYVDENGEIQQSNRVSARARRWLADKGFSGVAAEMGRNTTELARMEAARRGNLANADFSAAQATFAGINEKEATQRIADQEALMTSGRASFNGSILNVNNGKQLKGYHAQMLQTANDAKASGDTAAYNAAMDKVKAAQNLLSKTNTGRQSVQENLEAAAKSGASGGLNEAAGHLLNAHGPDYKAANRGMHKLIQDLATTDLGAKDNNGVTGIDRIKQGINDHSYDKAGIDKYTAQTLASADDAALDRLAKSALTGSMTDTEAETLFSTIQKASNNPNIHLQPEIKQKFDNIVYGLQQGQNIGSNGKVRR